MYPLATESEGDAIDMDTNNNDDDDDDVYDLGGAPGRTMRESELLNMNAADDTYDIRTTESDPTYDMLDVDHKDNITTI